jgi:hypothetical protein
MPLCQKYEILEGHQSQLNILDNEFVLNPGEMRHSDGSVRHIHLGSN